MTTSSRNFRLIAAFAGINILLVVVGWLAVVAPQRSAASTAAAAAALAQSQLDALQPVHPHGPAPQPTVHTSCIYKLDTALPSQSDTSSLLFELKRVATAAGVKITSVSPQPPTAMASGYTVLPVNLGVDGSYFSVTRFLHNLRALVPAGGACPTANGPLFAVTTVSFSGANPKGDIPATAGIDAFYYGVTAGATAPVSPAATDTTTTTGG